MQSFNTAREAKEYVVGLLVAEAERESMSLSETERKMMYFSETGWTLPEIWDVHEEFERNYDAHTYEVKIVSLAESYLRRTRQEDRQILKIWNEALRILRAEYHYLTILVENIYIHIPGKPPDSFLLDKLKLVGTALLIIVALMAASYLFNK